ncbi:outer membrane protein assembly factor BamB family protein [Micromonosporaceae bacterium Da 78-11]
MLASLLSLGLAAVVAAPAPVQAAGWDHPGYDAEDSYYNPAESTVNAATVGRLSRRWSVPLRSRDGTCAGTSAPIIAGGRIFATDQLGISAYQVLTGRLLWRFDWIDPGDTSTPSMSVAGDLLIAAAGDCNSQSDPDGTVTAFDVATGRVRWDIASDPPIYSFVVDKGVAVVSGESPSDDLATTAYRITDGRVAWTKPGYAASSVSADGRLLATRDTTTSALNITTGAVLWTKPRTWEAQTASPASDRFYVTDGTALTSVNATTGAALWTAPGKAGTFLATDGRRIYRADGNAIEALNATTGRRQWARQLSAETKQPVRAGGLLYTGGPVLNPATGAVIPTSAAITGTQLATGGRLYITTDTTLSSFAP